MGDAYFELGELTSKVGDKPAALAAHRKGLAIRRELALEPAADTGGNVAKSLFASATLLAETGNSAEALARLEERGTCWRACPSQTPVPKGAFALLGTVYRRIGLVFADTGKPAMAMAAYQHSLETLTRLVEDNSAVSDFRSRLADSNNSIGLLQWYTSKPGEGAGVAPASSGNPAEAGRRQPRRLRFPKPSGRQPPDHRRRAGGDWQGGRGDAVVRAGPGDTPEAGR